MNISLVVPVFNSEGILAGLVGRLHPVLEELECEYELILVNDGSQDGSWKTILNMTEQYRFVRGFNLMRNYGQHNALLCGIRAALYDCIVTIDDDLQHPPEEIPKLLMKLEEGYDVVYGTPQSEQHGLWRDLASKITKFALLSTLGVEIGRQVSALRVFRTYLRDAFRDYKGPYVSIDVLLTWGTNRFSSVQVRHDKRKIGTSNYNLSKLIRHAFNMITGLSTVPLQIASFLGFVFTLFGTCVLGYILISYMVRGSVVPGFAFLGSIIAIFSGVQLFAIGIIGEYIARLFFRSLNRPAYTVQAEVSKKEE